MSIEVGTSVPAYAIHTFQRRYVTLQPNGSASVKVVGAGWGFVGSRDETRWQAAGRPGLSYVHEGEEWDFDVDHYDLGILHGTLLDLPGIRSMPADRHGIQAMYERALSGPRSQRSADELESLGQLLAIAPVSSRTRLALWETLALMPQLRCEGPGVDRFGRTGVVLSVQAPQYAAEILVDLSQERVLEIRRIANGSLPFANASPGEYLLRTIFVIPGVDYPSVTSAFLRWPVVRSATTQP